MQTYFKAPLLAACAVIAIATMAVGVAQSNKAALENAAQNSTMPPQLASEMWNAAQKYVSGPVRSSTLRETDGHMTFWLDDHAVSAVVGGQRGTLVVTRDLGESEDADVDMLYLNDLVDVREVTIGFKRSQDDHWTWARFAPNGEPVRDANGFPITGQVHANAASQCFAATGTTTAPLPG